MVRTRHSRTAHQPLPLGIEATFRGRPSPLPEKPTQRHPHQDLRLQHLDYGRLLQRNTAHPVGEQRRTFKYTPARRARRRHGGQRCRRYDFVNAPARYNRRSAPRSSGTGQGSRQPGYKVTSPLHHRGRRDTEQQWRWSTARQKIIWSTPAERYGVLSAPTTLARHDVPDTVPRRQPIRHQTSDIRRQTGPESGVVNGEELEWFRSRFQVEASSHALARRATCRPT